SCGSASRKTCYIHASAVNGPISHDFAGDSSNKRWLTAVPRLVSSAEPVPTFGEVGRRRLPRIGDQTSLLLGQFIHARSNGEVIRRLPAAMQHDDQWEVCAAIAAWNVQFIASATRWICILTLLVASSVRQGNRRTFLEVACHS